MGGVVRSVVVGSDGSPGSIVAVEWVLAEFPDDVAVEVLHVREHPAAAPPRLPEHDPARVRVRSELGEPVAALVAAGRDADLLVVGRTGSGNGVGPMGATAVDVVRTARCPVAVVGGPWPRRARHVVVGVADLPLDRNPSIGAVRYAYSLPGVEVVDVVHACGATGSDPDEADELHRRSGSVLAAVVGAAGQVPAGVTIRQATSPDAADVALVAASRTADLVVVGSRTDDHGIVRGSISLDVCAGADTPVIVVR